MRNNEENLKKIISTNPDEEIGLVDLTSENSNLKNKIAILLSRLESDGASDIEEEVATLLCNMMGFFAKHVEDIPSFESLDPEQQKALLLKFKGVAQSISGRKIKSIDEMVQLFVFTVLSAIGENVSTAKDITAIEVMNKKHKHSFREFLKRMVDYETYKIMNPRRIAGETKEDNFISNAVVLGVKKAMQYEGLDFDETKINHNSLKTLEAAHLKYKLAKSGEKTGMGRGF